MESSKNESSEVYIKVRDLIYVLLKNLGIILIAGIVLGGALFGYRFAKKTTTANVLDTTVRISASETDKEYQTRVGNVERARDLQLELLPLINALFSDVNPIPVKAAMAHMGFCDNYLRLPLTVMEKQNQEKMFELMKKANIDIK